MWFKDNDTLEDFISEEMLYGLEKAVEALALADIAGTSGIQAQAYVTSTLVTLRKTLTNGGVPLGRGDRGVAEQHLHGAQVAAASVRRALRSGRYPTPRCRRPAPWQWVRPPGRLVR